MQADSLLTAVAGVAAAFAGFTGVIFAVGRFSRGAWSVAERNALVNMLVPSLVALFLSLVPLVALTGIQSDASVWRASNGLLALVHLALVTSALRLALRGELVEPIPLRFVLIPGGYVSVVASALVAAGVWPQFAAMIFGAGLVWFLLIAAIQFVLLIASQAAHEARAGY
jgi:hypothetical protein